MLSVAALAEILAYYVPAVDNLLDALTTQPPWSQGTRQSDRVFVHRKR